MTPPTVLITEEETALVARLAGRAFRTYCENSSHNSLEDLYQSGMIGLLEAKARFQPELGVPFTAYARRRIWGAIMDPIRTQTTVHMPPTRRQQVNQLRNAARDLRQNGALAGPTELAEQLGWTVEEVFQVTNDALAFVPVSTTDWRCDEDMAPEVILTDTSDSQDLHLLRRELAERVHRCLERLPSDLDRTVLLGRYLEDLKLRELAATLDCTEQAVSQRQKKAERRMKKCIDECDKEGQNPNDALPLEDL